MKKVILYIATSLDGYIADIEGGVSWLDPYNEAGTDYGYMEFLDRIGTVIMGNTTYKQVLGFGPVYPNKEVVVFSRQHLESSHEVTYVNGHIKAFTDNLKENSKADIWLVGGSTLIEAYLEAQLIDELIITVFPVILGSGIPLFKGSNGHDDYELVEVKRYEQGVTSTYKRK